MKIKYFFLLIRNKFNFQCYKEQCPKDTNSLSKLKICDSIYNYCIANEYYQAICSNTPFNE